MWYFSWILGTGLALSFAVLNAIWYEIIEQQPGKSGAGRTAELHEQHLERCLALAPDFAQFAPADNATHLARLRRETTYANMPTAHQIGPLS